jgi:putative ABC transport system permease protein
MSMTGLALANLWSKKARSTGLAFAVAVAVMTVVTLTAVSTSLEKSAAEVLTIGHAKIDIAQKGVSDVLASTIDQSQVDRIAATPGVKSAVGVLVEMENLNPSNPLFLEIGIAPADLAPFGVTVVAGHPYSPDAAHEMMMGWRAAQNFGITVGDRFHADGTWNTVVGIYSTGIAFGDLGGMFPLPTIQAYNRVPGTVTLVFANTVPGVRVSAVEKRIARQNPELTTITTATQFGRVDTSLKFLQAAETGSAILAIVIGAVIVGNAMLLSLFERTREFGLLRAVGWSRSRVVGLMLGEGALLGVIGAGVGIGLAFMATTVLEAVPGLRGILHTNFTSSMFAKGLYTGLGMTILGTLYPAIRAASLRPLKALSHE